MKGYFIWGRLLLIVVSVTAAYVIAETLLPVVLPRIGMSYLSRNALESEMGRVRFSSDNAKEGKPDAPLLYGTENIGWFSDYVVHPYLGFVANHAKDPAYNKFGFLGDPPPFSENPKDVSVGVFGGSVAWFLYRDGAEELARQIGQLSEYREKNVRVVSVALGAYKQPQQLMALEYFLSLGAHFDIIINLDGFNEAAGPYSYNIGSNVTPYFPHFWNILSRKTTSLDRLQTMLEALTVERKRYRMLHIFRDTFLHRSGMALIAWHIVDRSLMQQLYGINAQLEKPDYPEQQDFQITGPEPMKDKRKTLDLSLAIWQRSSLQMARIAAGNGIRYYHALQPNQYLPGSKPMGEEERKTAIIDRVSDDTGQRNFYGYKEAVEALYPEMRRAGAEEMGNHGIAFFDLTDLFSSISDPIYVDACCHYNVRGTRMVVDELVRRIGEDMEAHPVQDIR